MELRKKLISVAALAFTVALGAGMACMTASAETATQTKDGFAVTAVSVRTENFKDADGKEITDSSGIRFKTDVPAELEGAGYTKLTINGQSKEVNADVWRTDGSGWNTVVMGVPSTDYATQITAQSFLVVSETEAYTTEPVSYSIAQAAGLAQKNPSNADKYEQLDAYVSLATFEFGENGDATHADGSALSDADNVDNNNGYTLAFTANSKVFTGARDAKGNSALKLGTSSAVASFSFTVPSDVNAVIINVAQYKKNATSVKVNGEETVITTQSDNGEYTAIEVNTTTTKTITFESGTSGDERCMINSISYRRVYIGVTDYDKVNEDVKALELADMVLKEVGATINDLPATGEHDSTITWALEDAANGILELAGNTITVVALPAEDTTITLTATVNVNGVTATKEFTITVKAAFDVPEADSDLTIAEAIAVAEYCGSTYSEGKYYITGTIESIANTTYGNMTIKDENGDTLYIYNVSSEDGTTQYGDMEVKPELGDVVKLYGVLGTYNGSVQMKQAWLKEHTVPATKKLAIEETALKALIPSTVTEATTIDNLPNAGTTFSDVAISWSTPDTNSYVKVNDSTLTITLPDSGDFEETVTATLSVDGEEPKDITITVKYTVPTGETKTETLSIIASAGTAGTKTISWTSGVVTFTNNQASSTSVIRTSDSDHFRVYKSSEVVISTASGTLKTVVITCTSSSYATIMQTSLTNAGYKATVSDTVVTVTVDNATSIKFTASAQTRLNKVEVTYVG